MDYNECNNDSTAETLFGCINMQELSMDHLKTPVKAKQHKRANPMDGARGWGDYE